MLSFLVACAKPPLVLKKEGQISSPDGIYQKKVELLAEKQTYSCFVELKNHQMTGVSCQNSLGFAEFSGGYQRVKTSWVFEISNPLLKTDKAQLVVDLLGLSLFESYEIEAQTKLAINKTSEDVKVVSEDNELLFRVSQ